MSANIPEHMLLSDLLKATGYNCPANLQGKTFKEATAGDTPAELDDNKAVTIDASTYTQPVEVTPTEGKEGMKKCTVTLENIPQAGAKLYAWVKDSADTVYFSFGSAPSTAEAFAETFRLTDTSGVLAKKQNSDLSANYMKLAGSQFQIGVNSYMRDSSSDVTLW